MAYENQIEAGGSNIHYVFNVSGYPWAVATDKKIITLLNAETTLSRAARKKIFGVAYRTLDTFLCDHQAATPFFTGLHIPGRQKWSINESKGMLTGGDFEIEIDDNQLGHAWRHGGNQNVWGLEGVHRIARPGIDNVTAYGSITETFQYGDTDIVCDDLSGTLATRITARLATDGYALLWIGQECVVVWRVTSNADGTITIDTFDRGALLTHEQHHSVEEYGGISPIVTDSPMSVVDKPCWLWALVTDSEDTTILSAASLVRWGKVGSDIETKDGVTSIKCLSPLSILDNNIKPVIFDGGYFSKYILTRPSEDDSISVFENVQAPHITLIEWVDSYYYHCIQYEIWLVAEGTYEIFDTIDDVYDRINSELTKCRQGTSTINPRITGLYYTYYLQKDSGDNAAYIRQTKSEVGGSLEIFSPSYIGGSITFALCLGNFIINANKDGSEIIENAKNNFRLTEFADTACDYHYENIPGLDWEALFPRYYLSMLMACALNPHESHPSLIDWNGEHYIAPPGKRIEYVCQYYWQWKWSTNDIYNYKNFWNRNTEKKSDTFYPCDGNIYFMPGVDLSLISAGDTYCVGEPDKEYAEFTAVVVNDSATNPYITVGTTLTKVSGCKTPFRVGHPICYCPIAEGTDEDYDIDDDSGIIVRNDLDPWRVSGASSIKSKQLYKIFREILGGDGYIDGFPDTSKQYHIVGFRDVVHNGYHDIHSFIDWDDFATKIIPLVSNHTYLLNLKNEFNLLDLLSSEILFHGYCAALEWNSEKCQYMMTFRKIGPALASEAASNGRYVTNSNICYGQKQSDYHVLNQIYNRMSISCNEKNGDYKANINISYSSGNQTNRSKGKKLSINSNMSQITDLKDKNSAAFSTVVGHFKNIMMAISNVNPTYTTECTADVAMLCAVGREFLLSDPMAYIPWTHEQGVTGASALMLAMDVDLGARSNTVRITARIDGDVNYGYAPACYIDANNMVKGASYTIAVQSDIHTYTDTTQRVDCMYFDCLTYNPSTGIYTASGCSCGDYKVILFEDLNLSPTLLRFTIKDVASDGTFNLVDQAEGDNYDAIDVTKHYIMIFDTYDEVEPCQKKWLCLADDNGTLGTDNDNGGRFV